MTGNISFTQYCIQEGEQDILDCTAKNLSILPEDMEVLLEEYSEFADREDLERFMYMVFGGIGSDKIRRKKQEFREKYGIGTGNEFERHLIEQDRHLEINIKATSCVYCKGEIEEWSTDMLDSMLGYAQNYTVFGLCRLHTRKMELVYELLGDYRPSVPASASCAACNS